MTNTNTYEERPDEAVLLERLATGDKEAFAILFQRYQPVLTGLLQPFKDVVDIPDIVQEIFVRIWTKRELMVAVSSFKAYLVRMARNMINDMIRARAVRSRYKAESVHIESLNVQEDQVLFKEVHKYTMEAIAKLPERQQRIITWRLLHDLNREEMAGRLGVSIDVVDRDLWQATRTIRQTIETYRRLS